MALGAFRLRGLCLSEGEQLTKVALFIDGGHLRELAKEHLRRTVDAGVPHAPPEFLELAARACVDNAGEDLLRILYYDCGPYVGKARTPIEKQEVEFDGDAGWLRDLARRDYFAVREGELRMHGWKLRKQPTKGQTLTDADFKPNLQQKGVDMRIGIDIANLCATRGADRILFVSNDSDMIPAMKYARIAGLQVVAIKFPNGGHSDLFKEHVDLIRAVTWPVLPSSLVTSLKAAAAQATAEKSKALGASATSSSATPPPRTGST